MLDDAEFALDQGVRDSVACCLGMEDRPDIVPPLVGRRSQACV